MSDNHREKLAGIMAAEASAGRKAFKLGDDVPNIGALTREWLTDVLCRGVPQAEVTDFIVHLASAGTHDRHRLTLTYNSPGTTAALPGSIFTKTLPTLDKRAMSGIVALRESYFYNTIRPLLDIEAPRCYASTVSPQTFATIHAMEDLVATKGACFADHRFCVSCEMAEDMVRLLANLHARFLPTAERAPHDRAVPAFARQFAAFAALTNLAKYTEIALDDAGGRVPAGLRKAIASVWPATVRSLDLHRGPIQTLLHSDVHIGNWYQIHSGAMGLADWQFMGIGHWGRDLSYALATALQPEDRRRWEQDLVGLYANTLSEQSGASFPASEAWDAYRQQMLPALAMWTITLRHDETLPDMQSDEMSLTMIERISVAIDDLGSLAFFES
jgi:hypothetical protein